MQKVFERAIVKCLFAVAKKFCKNNVHYESSVKRAILKRLAFRNELAKVSKNQHFGENPTILCVYLSAMFW